MHKNTRKWKYYNLNHRWWGRWPWTWVILFIRVCALTMVDTVFNISDGMTWHHHQQLPNTLLLLMVCHSHGWNCCLTIHDMLAPVTHSETRLLIYLFLCSFCHFLNFRTSHLYTHTLRLVWTAGGPLWHSFFLSSPFLFTLPRSKQEAAHHM